MIPFEWLYDGLPEDGFQEHGSLRRDLASTPEEAAAVMQALVARDQMDNVRFAPGSLCILRAELDVWDDETDAVRETVCGSLAERLAVETDRLDELTYAPCAAQAEGAAEWWHVPLAGEPEA